MHSKIRLRKRDYVPLETLAEIAGMTPPYLRRLLVENGIHPVRVGSVSYVDEQAGMLYLRERTDQRVSRLTSLSKERAKEYRGTDGRAGTAPTRVAKGNTPLQTTNSIGSKTSAAALAVVLLVVTSVSWGLLSANGFRMATSNSDSTLAAVFPGVDSLANAVFRTFCRYLNDCEDDVVPPKIAAQSGATSPQQTAVVPEKQRSDERIVAQPSAPVAPVQQVIERIVIREAAAPQPVPDDRDRVFESRLTELEQSFNQRLAAYAASANTTFVSTPVFAQSQRIDNLSGVSISGATITGGSVEASSITGTLTNIIDGALATLGELTATNATFTRATTTDFAATRATITNATTTSLAVTGSATSSFGGGISATMFSSSATSTLSGLALDGQGLRFTTLDCTSFGNGGTLTTDASGYVVCAADDGGAGSTAGGSDTFVQFNSSGGFAGDAGFTYASTSDRLTVTNASTTALSASLGYFGTASSSNLLVSGTATTTNLAFSNLASALLSTNALGQVVATTSVGSSYITGALGTVNGTTFNRGDAITVSAASSTLLTDRNNWTGLNLFANASTTLISGTTAWFTTFVGNLTGDVTGNASTATALQTSRTINGTAFDGTQSITITAASSTLLSDNNSFTGLNRITFASSTAFSASTGYFASASTSALTVSNLTSGRIPFASTAGLLADSSLLTFDGTKFITSFASTTALTATTGYFSTASTTSLILSGIQNGLLSTDADGDVVATTTPTALSFNATSNTASRFPYASSTAFTASSGYFSSGLFTSASSTNLLIDSVATTTNLAVTGLTSSLLSTNALGQVVATTSVGSSYITGALGTVNGTTFNRGDSITISAASSTLLTDRNNWTGLNLFANASTTLLSGTTAWFTTFVGNLTGNVTGNVTGDVTGNASTATALQTSRTINGTAFDGTQSITITAASSTLLSDNNSFTGLNRITFASSTAFSASTGYFASASTSALTVSNLTSGRIPFASTAGLLADSSLLTFDGTKFITSFASTTALTATTGYFSTASTTSLILSGIQNGLLSTDADGDVVATTTPTALSFYATSNTASRFPYASTTALSVSGTAYFAGSGIWNSSGFVGIGTTTPAFNLTTIGTGDSRIAVGSSGTSGGSYTGFEITDQNNALRGGLFLENDDKTKISLWNATSRVITYNSSGYVGVGTTSPNARFHIEASTYPFLVYASGVANNSTYDAPTFVSPKGKVSMFIGSGDGTNPTESTASYGVDESSGNIRFNGAGVAWGDFGYYPNGGGNGNYGNFRLSLAGGVIDTVPDAKLGVGSLYSAGNVGIGTTSPLAKLAVHANSGETNRRLFEVASSTASATSSHFTILNSGYVGVGTSNPGVKLSLGTDFANTKLGIYDDGAGGTIGFGLQSGEFRFHVNAAGTDFKFLDAPAGNTLLTLKTQTGYLGVGTSTPQSKLDVDGVITVHNSGGGVLADAINFGLTGYGTGSYVNKIQSSVSGGGINQIAFLVSDGAGTGGTTNVMTLDKTGNVGIGTTTPRGVLSLRGATSESGLVQIYGTSGDADTTNLFAAYQDNAHAPSAAKFVIRRGGIVGVGTTTLATTNMLTVAGRGQFTGGTANPGGDNVAGVGIGYNTTSDYGWIQSIKSGVATKSLVLQETGGNVGIGDTTPSYALDVNGDINIAAGSRLYYNGSSFAFSSTTLRSTFVGPGAGNLTQTGGAGGGYNTGIGFNTLMSLTTGYYNTLVGAQAGNAITSGYNNTAMGLNAMLGNTIGTHNTAFGSQALATATSTAYTTAIGYQALYSQANYSTTVDGLAQSFNTGVGSFSLYGTTGGTANTGIGYGSAQANTTGTNNTALGFQAIYFNATGSNNIGIGYQALVGTTGNSFSNNIGIGTVTGGALTTGSQNILIGYGAGNNLTTGSNNIVIGHDIDSPAVGNSNTLNIGNLLYGTGLDGSGTSLSSGKIGVGVASPSTGKFEVHNSAAIPGVYINQTGAHQALLVSGSAQGNYPLQVTASHATFTGLVAYLAAYRSESSGYYFLYAQSDADGTPDAEFTMNGVGNAYADGTWNGGGADYAEWVTPKPGTLPTEYEKGSLICLVTSDPDTYGFCDGAHDEHVVGAISTFPSIVGNSPALATSSAPREDTHILLAMLGRVPLKVNLEGGDIAIGDRLAASSQPGVAMKATTTSRTVGFALEAFTAATATSTEGKILIYLDMELTLADVELETLASIAEFASSSGAGTVSGPMSAFLEGIFSRLTEWFASATNDIGEFFAAIGNFNTVNTETLCVGDTCVTEAQLQALLAGASASQSGGSGGGGETPEEPAPEEPPADTIAPVISVTGASPATINIGDTYSDLGASVTDEGSPNIGIEARVDGGAWGEIGTLYIDTAAAGTHTVEYRATDEAGNVGTAERVVEVVDPNPALEEPPAEE